MEISDEVIWMLSSPKERARYQGDIKGNLISLEMELSCSLLHFKGFHLTLIQYIPDYASSTASVATSFTPIPKTILGF